MINDQYLCQDETFESIFANTKLGDYQVTYTNDHCN